MARYTEHDIRKICRVADGFRANCLVRDGISAVQRCFHLALNDAHRRSASAGGSYRFLSSHAYIY